MVPLRPAVIALVALVLGGRAHPQGRVKPPVPADDPPLVVGNFPHVAVPVGNPMTPEKIQLGKALFFEEQLSVDDTMACATCHLPEAGGGDPRAGARAPGRDGQLNTFDDEFGSPGVVHQDASGNLAYHSLFGMHPQVTGRNAPSVIGAAFFNTQFWDGRAGPVFRTVDGATVLSEFASLESQAVEPPLSAVEMNRPQRGWDVISAKLARARPLALASDLPVELEQFIGDSESYGPLFESAFGGPAITRERVAMAIASYERTLVPDRTPFDLGTMTAGQRRGLNVFNDNGCQLCHSVSNGLFSDGSFQSLGFPFHPRAVKVPTLRNVGLRLRFMSNGTLTTMLGVLQFYQQIGLFFPGPDDTLDLRNFLVNGLTDPRVRDRLPPFDRPTLRSERQPPRSNLFGVATSGSGALRPLMLADSPPFLGNPAFRIGLGAAPGGAKAVLRISTRRSDPGAVLPGLPLAIQPPFLIHQAFLVPPAPPGQGSATFWMPLPKSRAFLGLPFYAQWFVHDPVAASGIAITRAAEFELFTRP